MLRCKKAMVKNVMEESAEVVNRAASFLLLEGAGAGGVGGDEDGEEEDGEDGDGADEDEGVGVGDEAVGVGDGTEDTGVGEGDVDGTDGGEEGASEGVVVEAGATDGGAEVGAGVLGGEEGGTPDTGTPRAAHCVEAGVDTLQRAGSSRARVVLTEMPRELELKREQRQLGLVCATSDSPTQQFLGGVEAFPCTKSRHGKSGKRAERQSGAGAGAGVSAVVNDALKPMQMIRSQKLACLKLKEPILLCYNGLR